MVGLATQCIECCYSTVLLAGGVYRLWCLFDVVCHNKLNLYLACKAYLDWKTFLAPNLSQTLWGEVWHTNKPKFVLMEKDWLNIVLQCTIIKTESAEPFLGNVRTKLPLIWLALEMHTGDFLFILNYFYIARSWLL